MHTSPLSVVVAFCWKDVWHEHNTQKMVAGDNTVALVSPLKPATSYHFRVLAENHLGTSAPSDILHVSIKKHFSISQKKKKERKKNKKIIIISLIHLIIIYSLIITIAHDSPPFRLTRRTFLLSLFDPRFLHDRPQRLDDNNGNDNRPRPTARFPVDRPDTLSPNP